MPCEKRTNAIDHSHHLSDLARRYGLSPLKGLQKYYNDGLIPFAGGALIIRHCVQLSHDTTPPRRPAQSRVFPLHLCLCRHSPSGRVPTGHATDHVTVCVVLVTARLALAPLRLQW